MSNLAEHIHAFKDKDDWLEHNIRYVSSWVNIFTLSQYEKHWRSVPISFEAFLYPLMSYEEVELQFNYPGTGIGVTYGYNTSCILHLLDHIFSQLPSRFTRDDFQSAAYKAIDEYEYDGSLYLTKEKGMWIQ